MTNVVGCLGKSNVINALFDDVNGAIGFSRLSLRLSRRPRTVHHGLCLTFNACKGQRASALLGTIAKPKPHVAEFDGESISKQSAHDGLCVVSSRLCGKLHNQSLQASWRLSLV